VAFSYTSHDGEGGYPGTLRVTADYRLTAANALTMAFTATTDKATVVNICNHACAYALWVSKGLRMLVFPGRLSGFPSRWRHAVVGVPPYADWNLAGDVKRDIKDHVSRELTCHGGLT
jgi:hypothetical protein